MLANNSTGSELVRLVRAEVLLTEVSRWYVADLRCEYGDVGMLLQHLPHRFNTHATHYLTSATHHQTLIHD